MDEDITVSRSILSTPILLATPPVLEYAVKFPVSSTPLLSPRSVLGLTVRHTLGVAMRAYTYIVPWIISYFAAHAAPTDGVSLHERSSTHVKRAPKPAGIGVELEVRNFEMTNNDPRVNSASAEAKAAVKGADIFTLDYSIVHTCGKNWALTAEPAGAGKSRCTYYLTLGSRRRPFILESF